MYPTSAASLLVALVVAMIAALVVGLFSAGRRAVLSAASLRGLAVGFPLAIAAWLALTTALAHSGVFQTFDARPPRLPMVMVGMLVTSLILTRTQGFRRMLAVAPREWPIALETFRVGIELCLYLLFLDGLVPVQMTLEGGNFDILVGLTAPLVALAVRKAWGGRWLVALWNVGGLVSLVNVVRTVVRALPGPLHVDLGGVSPIVLTTAPFVWVPAFVLPIAVLGHVISLRQLLGDARVARARLADA
jgi:hypothetical protein